MNNFKFNRVIISIFLMATIIFSSSMIFLYADETTTTNTEKPKVSEEKSKLTNFAKKKGDEYGGMYAGRDYMNGLSSNYKRYFADKKAFNQYFRVSDDVKKSYFYNTFIDAFQKSYESTYLELSIQDKEDDSVFWYTMAKKYSSIEGQIAAYHDFLNEYPCNSDSALKKFLKQEDLSERFKLYTFSGNLLSNFKSDFSLYFKKEYKDAYIKCIDEENQMNTNYYYIDSAANTIDIQKSYKELSKSSIIVKQMPSIQVEFPDRAVLERTPMAIKYRPHQGKRLALEKGFVPVSDVYELELQRGIDSVIFHENPTLKFNGYAVRGAGIYKWKDSKWKYITTNIQEGGLSTELPKGEYKNTQFAVFIDDNFKMPSDISFSWAFNDINIALKRNHVKYDVKMRPDAKITRAELADMLYKTLAYRKKHNANIDVPVDANKNMYNVAAIRYCIASGYLNNYSDGYFKPESRVSYDEFEKIFKKAYGYRFSMTDLADKEKNIRYFRSDYYTSSSSNISRAEVIFALNYYLD